MPNPVVPRRGKWQARVQTKGHAALSKTFINKADAERWAKQVEVQIQKDNYAKLILTVHRFSAKIIKRHVDGTLATMRKACSKNYNVSLPTEIMSHGNMFYNQINSLRRPHLVAAQ